MADPGGQDISHQAADRAGEYHGADDHAIHLDTGIAGGALALANDGDLITVLAVCEIDIHHAGQQGDHQNGEQLCLSADAGQPAGLGSLVDDADLTGAFGHLPYDDKVGGQLHGDVVHHQGEQRLVGVPSGLEEGGQEAPYGAGQQRGRQRDDDQQEIGDLAAQQDHAGGGGQAADQGLPLGADVPEAHLECGRYR